MERNIENLSGDIASELLAYQQPNIIGEEKLFLDLINLFPLPIALIKIDGSFISYNNKLVELFHFENLNLYSENLFNWFVFDESKIDFFSRLDNSISFTDLEIELLKKDNQFFMANVSARRTVCQNSDALFVVLYDVTVQKEIEEERERLLEELAMSRAQIEDEAAKYIQLNNQLEVSEEKLKDSNATKDKFFSIIGHDLKNPLFVIQSMSEILETEFNETTIEEKMEFIKAIRESSKNAFALLEDLLHWARCQSGRIDYNPEPIHPKQIASKCINLLEAHALNKNLSLVNSVDATLIAFADKFMVETVIRNLTSNAIKFTPTGGTVKITGKVIGDFIQLGIEDTGIGLSENDIQKLFRIDVKNTEIGKSKEKGTGLGLILCKEFVEKHNGKIWVESELEKGSKFIFTIPKLS